MSVTAGGGEALMRLGSSPMSARSSSSFRSRRIGQPRTSCPVVAPTDPLPVVRYDTRAGERSLDVIRWGLMPFWAKDFVRVTG
jgi:putative SOS response-associated peptidase YedK